MQHAVVFFGKDTFNIQNLNQGAAMNLELIKKHLLSISFLLSVALGFLGALFLCAENLFYRPEELFSFLFIVVLGGIFFVYPFILTTLNLLFLVLPMKDPGWIRRARHIEYITVLLGALYSFLAHILYEIQYNADWEEVLINNQVHTPVWTEGIPTVFVLSVIGMLGYLFLSCICVRNVPPLVTVLAMAAMYIGVIQCILWILQIISAEYFLLCLFPFNCIILAAKTIRRLIWEWEQDQQREIKSFGSVFLDKLNQKLVGSNTWPVAAFLMMWPLLGISVGILVLFGQRPDAVIRAWTETSDWNLSHRVAPQNIYFDEHYLCTVAAGGHEAIVKPIRLGERHGHPVIVNRQLCVANAFEQILEEKMPRFHRHVRHFYDTYGFPIAKRIHSPCLADIIYVIMKPLEWLFLMALYFTDACPENRIALQYIPPKEAALLQKKIKGKKI